MSLSTITIGGEDYVSYASVAEADIRLAVDPVRSAAWAALTPDQKGANLVASTYRLDLLHWVGEKTGGPTQPNDWPRTGVQYKDGTPVPDNEVPMEVECATILVAGDITLNPTAGDAGTSGSNIKGVKAGSAQVDFFRPVPGAPLQNPGAFQLVACFLDTGTGALNGAATGTGGESAFCPPDQLGRIEGFS